MEMAPDFDEFIGSLTAHGVEFLIVGANALAFHGAPPRSAASSGMRPGPPDRAYGSRTVNCLCLDATHC